MTYTQEEAQKAAHELVEATIKVKELQAAIKDYKAGLLEYAEIESINDTSWNAQNGYVELHTVTKYVLDDIPVKPEIQGAVISQDIAEEIFNTKLSLNKEGKKLLKHRDPDLMSIMVPECKPKLKVILKVDPETGKAN